MTIDPQDASRAAEPPFAISTAASSGGLLVTLTVHGELDDVTAPELQATVAFVLAGAVPAVVRLDLAGMTFLGSAGIHCLLACRERALAAGSRLELADPTAFVLHILDITGMVRLFGLPADPVPGRTAPTGGTGPHHDQSLPDVFARSAHLRDVARATQARARAARTNSARRG